MLPSDSQREAEWRAGARWLAEQALRTRLAELEVKILRVFPQARHSPGLTPAEFDEIWARHEAPFPAPYEIRVWFEWHNPFLDAPFHSIWSLDDHLESRRTVIVGDEGIPHDQFVPLTLSATGLVADCSAGREHATPLHWFGLQDTIFPRVADSLAAMVEMWHYAADHDWWVPPVPGEYVWEPNAHLLPPQLQGLQIPGINHY